MFSNYARVCVVGWMACVCLGASPAARADAPATLVAGAAVPWHGDLAAATQAALVSHRPVLVVCVAGSSESAALLTRDVFSAAETVALLTACFEPVRVDVDVDPTTARTLGITQVPCACIVDGQHRLLARFDCPTTPAAFVAAASRAAQEAATSRSAGDVTQAAAIREQSDFVRQAAPPAAQPVISPWSAPAPAAAAPAPALTPAADLAQAEEPSLPAAPPAWPAEPTARPMPFTAEPHAALPTRPAIEPATSAPGATTPWLTAPAAGSAPAAIAATQATAPAAAATTPPAAPAEPEKKSATSAFFAALQKPFTVFSKPKAEPPAAPPSTPAPTPGTAVAASPRPAATADASESMPLGLEGYCPVSLVDKGTWVEGRAQWGARHRGRTYLFAGSEQQQAFLATPDRYAPALSGDDPVLACDSGRQVAGQRRFGVTYQARTYLFSSPETRAAFAANPQRYTARVIIAERPAASGTVVR